MALVDLVQDFDVLSPLLDRLDQTPGVSLRVAVSRWLDRRAPRIGERLRRRGAPVLSVRRSDLLDGRAPALDGVDAVLTAAESTAGPHRWAHAFVLRARAMGAASYTVQHGLDNLHVLAGPPQSRLDIASEVLFGWAPPEGLPADLDPATRAKIVPVGRALPPGLAYAPAFDVGLFDNLHARSYSDDQRLAVLDHIVRLPRALPGVRFYIRAHPAGGWLDRAAGAFRRMPNVVFVSSAEARRSPEPGFFAVSRAARVITTPSTVALDAAQHGRPVALALDGGELYSPLPRLADFDAWVAFAEAPAAVPPEQAEFLARCLLEGDAASRIVAYLAASGGKPRAPALLSQ